jgi:hypothetical protein
MSEDWKAIYERKFGDVPMTNAQRQALIDANHQQHVLDYYATGRDHLRRAIIAEKRLERYDIVHNRVFVFCFFAISVAICIYLGLHQNLFAYVSDVFCIAIVSLAALWAVLYCLRRINNGREER